METTIVGWHYLASEEYTREDLAEKVEKLTAEVKFISGFPRSLPQASQTTIAHGLIC